MQPLQARVQNGRLILDEPTQLPDGHVVDLLPLDELLSLVDDVENKEPVTFSFVPVRRQWKKPKTVDAAAILDELRSL